MPGAACALADPCSVGVTDCVGGSAVCVHAGGAPDGTRCGNGDTCFGGACGSCAGAGQACTLPGDLCATGTRFCNGNGTSVCTATGNVADGTACGGSRVCIRGGCVDCAPGGSCSNSADPCHAGVMACASGVATCMRGGPPVANGTSCGSGAVCNDGSCFACVAGASCDAGNACQAGSTTCGTGSPVCVGGGPVAVDGTPCGAGSVCAQGACIACVTGAPCAPSAGNGCLMGSMACAKGPECIPGAPVTDGTSCGYALVCVGGGCVSQLSLSAVAGPFQANLTWDGPLATLGDAVAADTAGDLTVTIDWGDQTSGAGTLTGSNGTFAVSGAHTYSAGTLGLLPVSVTITDAATGSTVDTTVTMNVGIDLAAAGSPVYRIAVDPAGDEWFTVPIEQYVDDRSGVDSRYDLPVGAFPVGIAVVPAPPSWKVWFADAGRNLIGQITPGAVGVTVFPVAAGAQPAEITLGPDGNLWFTEPGLGQIGRLTPGGSLSEFAVPALGSVPTGIAAGPDGNVWFTDSGANAIGRVLTAGSVGQITEYSSNLAVPQSITTGPDGNLWFGQGGGDLGLVTPAGLVSTLAVGFGARAVFLGPDGNVWYADSSIDATVGRVTPSGSVTTFTVPFEVLGFASGSGGTILMATDQGVASFTP